MLFINLTRSGRGTLCKQVVKLCSTYVSKQEFNREISVMKKQICDLQRNNVVLAKSHKKILSGLHSLSDSQDVIQDSVFRMSVSVKDLGVKIEVIENDFDKIENDINSIRKESFNTKAIIRDIIKNVEVFEHHYREYAVNTFQPSVPTTTTKF